MHALAEQTEGRHLWVGKLWAHGHVSVPTCTALHCTAPIVPLPMYTAYSIQLVVCVYVYRCAGAHGWRESVIYHLGKGYTVEPHAWYV